MEHIAVVEEANRYRFRDLPDGVSEAQPLDFHSPYGCSKGAADQYVHDYARIYGLRTVVFRMSCIYGPRQFGTEDQGWVAHFIISALTGRPITIYGSTAMESRCGTCCSLTILCGPSVSPSKRSTVWAAKSSISAEVVSTRSRCGASSAP